MFKNPAYELKISWVGGDVTSDIYMTKKAVTAEVKELLDGTNEITKIEIEIVGISE